MSGPKVSQVNLDIQRRAELQRERERKSKIIFEIKNKVKILNNFNVKTIDSNISDKLTKKLELLKEKFHKSLNNISNKANISKSFAELEVINRDSEKILREFKEDYESIFKNIETTINKISKFQSQEDRDKLISLFDKISVEKKEGAKSISIDIKNIVDKIIKTNNQSTENIKKSEFKEIEIEKRDSNKIFDFSNFSKSEDKKNESTLSIEDIEIIIKEISEKLSDFLEKNEYTVDYRQQVLDMKTQLLKLEKNDSNLDVKKELLLERKEIIESNLKRIQLNSKEIESLYKDYLTEVYSLNYSDIKSIRDFSSKEEIKNEIAILKKKVENISIKNYIKEQLDDVMMKHGYNMIDSEYIERVKTDNRLLYKVNDSTGIDVFMSDAQEEMMTLKIVGIGFDEEMTERESDDLYEEQCNFCSMFPELVEELRVRGVIFKEVRYNEADKKHNTKIKVKINSENRVNKRKSKENINNKKYREIER